MTTQNKIQLDRFKKAARELEADDDERFEERLKKLVQQKQSEKTEKDDG